MNSQEKKAAVDMNSVKSRVLLECLTFSFLISLLPFKIVSYFLPVLLLLYVIVRLPSKTLFRNLFFTMMVLGGVFLLYFLKSIGFHHDFSFIGSLLSLLTYGSLIFAFIYPGFHISEDSDIVDKLNRIVFRFFIVETIVSLLQFFFYILMHNFSFDGATGDIIQGTINPLSFINENVGFNNQVFTINYVFLLVYLIPYLRKTNRRYLLVLGVMVILLASVLHVVFSFVFGLLTCLLLVGFIRYRKQVTKIMVVIGLLLAVLFVTQPKNFSLLNVYYVDLVSLKSPKSLVLINTVVFLPQKYPDALLFGLGPGQYTSRASLMTTGHYFGEFENPTRIPFLDGSFTSKAFKDYVFDIWEAYATNTEQYGNSTMSRPFFSILSVCVEFGFIAFLGLVFWLSKKLLKMRKKYLLMSQSKNKALAYYSFVNITCVLFLFYLSFFENYLESSASICGGLLLIIFFQGLKRNDSAFTDS